MIGTLFNDALGLVCMLFVAGLLAWAWTGLFGSRPGSWLDRLARVGRTGARWYVRTLIGIPLVFLSLLFPPLGAVVVSFWAARHDRAANRRALREAYEAGRRDAIAQQCSY